MMKKDYKKCKLNFFSKKILKAIIIIGALNWGAIGLLNTNPVELFFPNRNIQRAVYLLVGIAGLAMFYMMVMWLSGKSRYKVKKLFSESILPTSLLCVKPQHNSQYNTQYNTQRNNGFKELKIKIEPNKKIIYWAALEDKDSDPTTLEDVEKAYGEGTNSGTAVSNKDGLVKIKYLVPQGYKVEGKEKKPHVHYRVIEGPMMLGPVMTIEV